MTPEEKKAKNKLYKDAYYAANKEKIAAAQKTPEARAKRRAVARVYRAANAEKFRLYNEAYRAENADAIKMNKAAHYAANKESVSTRAAAYRAKKSADNPRWRCRKGDRKDEIADALIHIAHAIRKGDPQYDIEVAEEYVELAFYCSNIADFVHETLSKLPEYAEAY